jgi:flagellar biosynthetic protein FliQ
MGEWSVLISLRVHADDFVYCLFDVAVLLSQAPEGCRRMTAQDAITVTQQAMLMALLLGAPILLAGVLVGLLIGLAQALTQIQDQTVAFVPKIVAMVAVLILCLPWLVQKLVDYSEGLIANIPRSIAGN